MAVFITMTPEQQIDRLTRFIAWLDRFGEVSYDHQSFFASDRMRRAKDLYYQKPALGTLIVGPIIFCEAFAPWMRTFFHHPLRFPIADAHYAMGFAFLARALERDQYREHAVHFLEALLASRCPGFQHHAWGYPFHWQTRNGTIEQNTPLITTLPYVYEAFREVYRLDGNPRWREIMHSIALHGLEDYRDLRTSEVASSCAYTPRPDDPALVVNASAYRSFLLHSAAHDLGDPRFHEPAVRNLQFVLESQSPDGSWPYAMDGVRDFVDHFHTCFVLKALAKIEQIEPSPALTQAIERGVAYYVNHLFEADGLPKPFARRPRLTVYRRELYDCAECINLGMLLGGGRFPALDERTARTLELEGWQKPDGSFRSRQLLLGWDNVPMHRWAQSQIFRSLAFALLTQRSSNAQVTREENQVAAE